MTHLSWFAGLSVAHVVLLLAASFAGSLMTASIGLGGGAFLLVVMAELVPLLGHIAPEWIPLCVALFILAFTWLPLPRVVHGTHPLPLVLGGFFTTLATVQVGATGPLVSAWLGRAHADRWAYTANFSSCMTLQHTLKLAAFSLAGFVFLPWLPLLALMIVCGYLGTLTGLKVLGKMRDGHFKPLFRLVMTALAGRILWSWFSLHGLGRA
ncbi:hypothetical protein [Acidihalobacter aeolianus]|nr:hypothetical protein [Acidihalobacter aeolianus]